MAKQSGIFTGYDDVWLLGGLRTPFVDYNGALAQVSPTDLGIKVAREAFGASGVDPTDVGHVFAGNMAQASFDVYCLPRHVGLYSGVPVEVPATMTQRVCGTGVELIMQAGDRIKLGQIALGLCVGTESMSRNPIASYTQRGGFRMGQVEFKDFLWESLLDPAPNATMGDTAENLAKRYEISRDETDRFAHESFERAIHARQSGFLAGEITPVINASFELSGYRTRGIRLATKSESVESDTHIRPSPLEKLAQIRPAFGGVQTGGNSSAIVDGAAAALVASGEYVRARDKTPLARIVAGTVVGVPPEIMGIGPAPAIRALVERCEVALDAIDRFEINEAFGAQCLAVIRELGIARDRVNVNGGAIAIGHPLGATGVRLTLTLARELRRSGKRYGIASACIGGGQGIALLVENPAAAG
jgi:acetyl-CoA C-acetyltransferase